MAWSYEGASKGGHNFVICVLLLSVQNAGSLECSSCTSVFNISDCHGSTTCGPNEHCFTDVDGIGQNANFSLGCRKLNQCGIHANSNTRPPAIVGRDVSIRAITDCRQCCNTDYCNRKICIHPTDLITNTSGSCIDDADYNCQFISGVFDICSDIHHAKTVCRKFCGLCDLAHGGWTDWEHWGSCSQTCGIGLMKRNRQCASPYPGPLGNPCFGDYTDNKLCMLQECPDVGASKGGYIFVVCVLLLSVQNAGSLECSSCTNVNSISDCHASITCGPSEHCFTDVDGIGPRSNFSLGCRQLDQCGIHANSNTQPPAIVGRDVSTRASTDCRQCCNTDYCNRKICTHSTDLVTNATSSCIDDADYNCQLISGVFDVCSDIHHAKIVCRKFCGLCDLVDGQWTAWSAWSDCGVTCDTGRKTRQRTCTNPAPANGGLDCSGQSSEMSNCTLAACPVHGGWTVWERWGTCSQTCGIGLMKRNRQCSQPFPGPHGNPCFGDYTDNKICMLQDCPHVDGGWSQWATWTTCSATCNDGLMTRGRSCNHPRPSPRGTYCDGRNMDSQLCNMKKCPDPIVFFVVKTPNAAMVNNVAVFHTVQTHAGNEYSTTTGKFTCTIPGLYHFSVTFTSHIVSGSDTNTACYIRKNNGNEVGAYNSAFGQSGRDYNWRSASASAYVSLVTGDTVDVGGCDGWDDIGKDIAFIFNGALITAS